jgi:hypothetical protein
MNRLSALFILASYLTLAACFTYWPLGGRERIEHPVEPMMTVMRSPVGIAPQFKANPAELKYNPMTGQYEQ